MRLPASDEWRIVWLAALLSVAAYVWYDTQGLTLLFNDARIRELIARRVVSSRTPGLAQLGTTWLPLSFLMMLPFVWNDALFRSGLAASLPSMVAYVVASVYMYRTAHLVTGSRAAAWVAALALMLNPSLLYMQTTSMSETASLSALVVAIYYALRVTRSHHPIDIVKCGAAVAAGTLIRYENWFFAILLVPVLAYAGWRVRGYVMAEAWTVLYGLLAFAGCVAWVIYNAVIFHDPLASFFYGNTAHTFAANAGNPHLADLAAQNHPAIAFETYGYTVIGTAGWIVVALALLGLIAFAWRARLRVVYLPAYLVLAPFAFYWLVLYYGVNTVTMPELGTGPYYQTRFGLLMIPAISLFLAVFAISIRRLKDRLIPVAITAIVGTTIIGSALQTPFVLREALYGPSGASTLNAGQAPATYLASHYRSGDTILISYANTQTAIFDLLVNHGIPDRALMTDANGSQFTEALAHPESSVSWILMSSDASNGASRIWDGLQGRQDWRQYFVLRWKVTTQDGTTEIYERSQIAGQKVVAAR